MRCARVRRAQRSGSRQCCSTPNLQPIPNLQCRMHACTLVAVALSHHDREPICSSMLLRGSACAAAAACPPFEGYVAAADKDVPLFTNNDIGSYISPFVAATACSSSRECGGFTSTGWAKRSVFPTTDALGICVYTKAVTSE